ncbi:MAG: deoxyribodipyrimidine photo-lyase [Gammaproteobacteria bacterium]|nr:deoxyribodipyrimidine photo-lyase [Gammaproteobacteria bacterium]MYD77233.1 deoxyribodipyrimidine photo-lyase [Gammaproteobacteria bacterium]MYJ53248.1 deoxyribodipyrimidine photo-lyase [Gammaproteobacteria bacterium]
MCPPHNRATAVVWLRRDFRLTDNPAIRHAVAHADQMVLLYIHAPHEECPWQPGAASNWWLHKSLSAFRERVLKKRARLIIRRGDSLETLIRVCRETGAKTVCWNRLYEPAIMKRDRKLGAELTRAGIEAFDFGGALLREPGEVVKDDGTVYRVFTPYCRRHASLPAPDDPLPEPDYLPAFPDSLDSLEIGELDLLGAVNWHSGLVEYWEPGEKGTEARLRRFFNEGLERYGEDRDRPALAGVSGLSAHLHFGEISSRQVWMRMREGDSRPDAAPEESPAWPYLRQLIWRDFACHLLHHNPRMSDHPLDPMYENFAWESNPELLERWKRGETGIPLVDAGMRQLWQTGWMHNRVRMIVASVLCKNGLVHWLEGARWFWDTLVDADLANNTMGWQWVAGCGPDAAPYFRIFSPRSQGEKFDPEGHYIRQWVPELADVPARYIHEPWKRSGDGGTGPGARYPEPAIDLNRGRLRALDRYRDARAAWTLSGGGGQ